MADNENINFTTDIIDTEIYEQDVEVVDETKDVVVETEIETIEVFEADAAMIESDSAFSPIGEANESLRHTLLTEREVSDQHPITAITGLRDELDDIKALKTVYADKRGIANYYKWNNGAYNEYGYFVSLVPYTSEIKICDGADIFGVTVDAAGFIGGQDESVPRDNTYAPVATSGLVSVRCETTVAEGDYVVSNAYGRAEKTDSGCGYKVVTIENKNGTNYALISLGVQACTTDILGQQIQHLDGRVDNAEGNIIAAMNVANAAYNKANEVDEISEEAIKNALEAIDKATDASEKTDKFESRLEDANTIAAQAKAIAESAATSAESMKNEAVEKANEALAETSELRKELDAKVAEIDTDLENTALELQATKESIESTRDELRSNINDVSAELENTKTDLNTTRDELSTDINNTKTELNTTREQLQSSIDSTSSELSKTKEKLSETTSSFEELKEDLTPLTVWPDAENPTGVAGFVARADEDSVTLGAIVEWQGETNTSIAAFKQEVSETYATIDSVTQLETDTSNAIAGVKQEASETYATIESVATLETETSDAIAGVKQEAAETYATIESVSTLKTETSESIAEIKQEAADTYATIDSVATLKTDTTNAISGLKQEASETYATIESVSSLKTETSEAIAGVKQEASEKYATIESVTSLETNTLNAIAGVKQEVSETYATIESVASLKTDTSKSIADFKQEVQNNYATQAMLTEVNDSLTSFKQEVEDDYATQEMVTAVDNSLTSYKQEVSDTYATQQMVTNVDNALTSYKQEVEDDYATQEMVTSVDNALTSYKQEVEENYATQQMLSTVEDNLASFQQEVEDNYATQQMVTAVGDNLTSYKQEVGETYATQEMVTKLETDTSKALADYKQEVSDTYTTQEMVTKLETDTSKALTDYKQEVGNTYATQASLTALKTETTKAIAASEEKATETYASKSDLTSFEGQTNSALARVEQKADENGASINSIVSNVDKYSVGEYSQSYGLTHEQAISILKDGMIYVPTKHNNTQSHSETFEDTEETNNFTPGSYYMWDGNDWIEHGTSVAFFSEELTPSNVMQYWYIDSNEAPEGYEPHALYINQNGQWTKVNILEGNVNNRMTSMLRQTTDRISAEVASAQGSVVKLSGRITDTEAIVQNTALWAKGKSAEGEELHNIATVKQTASGDGSNLALVVADTNGNKVVNGASIVLNNDDNGSSISLDADYINFNTGTFKLDADYINLKGYATINDGFSVDKNGYMNAKSGGTIGGFTIGDTNIFNTKVTYGDNNTGVYLGVDGIGLGQGTFYVRDDGYLYSTNGDIGGWMINGTAGLAKDNEQFAIRIKCPTAYGSGGDAGASDVIIVRDKTKTGDEEWPFTVHSDGTLRARKAIITGEVNATSGVFDNCTINEGCVINGAGLVSLNNTNRVTFGKIYFKSNIPDVAETETASSYYHITMGLNSDPDMEDFRTYASFRVGTHVGSGSGITMEAFTIFLNGTPWSNVNTVDDSDQNLKNTITSISPSYSALFDSLRPVTFKFNNGTSNRLHTGFIAQEVDEAISVAGLTRQDFAGLCILNEGTEDERWGLRYGEFVALNTYEIQKLKARVAELETKLENKEN